METTHDMQASAKLPTAVWLPVDISEYPRFYRGSPLEILRSLVGGDDDDAFDVQVAIQQVMHSVLTDRRVEISFENDIADLDDSSAAKLCIYALLQIGILREMPTA